MNKNNVIDQKSTKSDFLSHSEASLQTLEKMLNCTKKFIQLEGFTHSCLEDAYTSDKVELYKCPNIAYVWCTALGKYLGVQFGLNSGFFDEEFGSNFSSDSMEISAVESAYRDLIKAIKFKTITGTEKMLALDGEIAGLKVQIADIVSVLPFDETVIVSIAADVEARISDFLTTPTMQTLYSMLELCPSEEIGVTVLYEQLGELCSKVTEKIGERHDVNSDDMYLVNTMYYAGAVGLDKDSDVLQYQTIKSLICRAFECYVDDRLSKDSKKDDYLASLTHCSFFDNKSYYPRGLERMNINQKMRQFLDAIVSLWGNTEEDTSTSIEEALSEDDTQGRFKLTYFKFLARQSHLETEMKTNRIVLPSNIEKATDLATPNAYDIHIEDNFVKRLTPFITYDSTKVGNSISVYCGENGSIQKTYWWDYGLNYEKLVSFLLGLQDSLQKDEKSKFKLTLFKSLATSAGLKPELSETPLIAATNTTETASVNLPMMYNISFNNGILERITPAVSYDVTGENHCINVEYLVKGEKRKKGYWWDNALDYKKLVTFLVQLTDENVIEDKGFTLVKFPLTEFKTACLTTKVLNVNMEKTEVSSNRYLIRFTRNFVTTVIVDQFLRVPNYNQLIYIQVGSRAYKYTWGKTLNLEDLVGAIVHIEEAQRDKWATDAITQHEEKQALEVACAQTSGASTVTEADFKNNMRQLISTFSIKTSKELKEQLLKIGTCCNDYFVNKDTKVNLTPDFDFLRNRLINSSRNIDDKYLQITLGSVSEKLAQGKSKSWSTPDEQGLVISMSAENRKKIEGIIEGFVQLKVKENPKYTKTQIGLLTEGVTYMYCRTFGLDVRTYCISQNFTVLLKGTKNNLAMYLSGCSRLYLKLLRYFLY